MHGASLARSTVPSSRSLRTTAPAPITHFGPTLIPSRMVAFTPTNDISPTTTCPDMTACEAMKQWSPMRLWCPMWLPLHTTTSSPICTNGWITFASNTNVFSPTSSSLMTIAFELT